MTFGEQNTEADGHAQMDYALESGINFFDTAEMYSVPSRKETQGSTERIIGTWFKKTGNRDKIILASKVTGPFSLYQLDRGPFNFSAAQINAALEDSLQRLQTDYIDLYQLHWPERKMNMFGKRGFVYDPNDPWVDNFNEVLNAEGSETSTLPMLERDLRKQNSAIQTLQSEFNRLSRQFWVPKQDILDAKYDLSSDRYRQVERDEQFCVNTPETLARIDLLESALAKEFKAMRGLTK